MDNEFYRWHKIKNKVNNLDSSSLYFKERDIWWCYYGANIGLEQNGKGEYFLRPVLVFKKFSRNSCWVIPLSTQVKKGDFYFPLLSEANIIRIATLPQMRIIDAKRLHNRIDSISFYEFSLIKEKVTDFIR